MRVVLEPKCYYYSAVLCLIDTASYLGMKWVEGAIGFPAGNCFLPVHIGGGGVWFSVFSPLI